MHRFKRRSVGFLIGLTFSSVCAFADNRTALSAFRYLCIGGGYISGTGPDFGAYPHAIALDPNSLLSELPQLMNAQTVDAWDLMPQAQISTRLALAIGLFDHPTMGQMASCIVLADGVSKIELEDGLLKVGAERDGEFIFMEGISRLWFVSVGAPESGLGDGVLIAATPNGSAPD